MSDQDSSEQPTAPKSFLPDLGLAQKARGAVQAATDGAAAIKSRATDTLSSLSEQATKQAQAAIGAGLDQVAGVAADLNTALPLVKQAGYSLQSVQLSASLTPTVVAAFHVDAEITDEQAAAIESEHADNTFALTIIRTLRHAAKLQRRISIGSLKPKELSISIGLSPSVSLRFA
jgi:hypothetical protein